LAFDRRLRKVGRWLADGMADCAGHGVPTPGRDIG